MEEKKGQDPDPRAVWGPTSVAPRCQGQQPLTGSAKIRAGRTKGQVWAALYFQVPDRKDLKKLTIRVLEYGFISINVPKLNPV